MKKTRLDAAKARPEDRLEDHPAPTRFNRHHLPWDRFSKGRIRKATVLRPSINAQNPDLDDLASEAWRRFKNLNEPPFLFRREGKLCRIEADDGGAPIAVSIDVPRLHFMLEELIDWVAKKKGTADELISVRAPKDLAQHLVADPDPPVPTLQRIVTAPIFASNGQLLEKPGDYADGVIYLPPKTFRLAALSRHPDKKEIQSAVNYLKHNLLADFCFVGESEVANCLAALLTPLVREMIPGPTPLFWIDKSTGGSGGTLLSNVIAAPLLGAPPSGITAPRDEAEWDRTILSTLRRSPNVFFIDNCNQPLSSEALAHAITAPRYAGRIIGSSNNDAPDVRCLWIINGNNLRLGWELARRVVRIRIDPPVAPDQRDSRKFIHPDLLSWVVQNRAEVLFHLIVLVKAWQATGCPGPAAGTPDFGSFTPWREVVGGIMNTAGISGFLLNLEDARQAADQESADLRAFVEAWLAELKTGPVFASDLLPIGRRLFELPDSNHGAAIRLGLILSKYENQTHAGSRIRRLPASHGKTQWRLQPASEYSR